MVAKQSWIIGDPEQSLRIKGLRGGTINEISAFLSDLERAYNALYWFSEDVITWREIGRRRHPLFEIEPFALLSPRHFEAMDNPELIPPDYRIELRRVSIQSPGFWEFIGGMNPLAQLREYLKDRHERRKDKEYRECAEKERLKLDNELLQKSIIEKENSILRERVTLLRDMGYDDADIRQIVWERLGPPLSRLGRHQDTGLIEGPIEDTKRVSAS